MEFTILHNDTQTEHKVSGTYEECIDNLANWMVHNMDDIVCNHYLLKPVSWSIVHDLVGAVSKLVPDGNQRGVLVEE